MIAAKVTLAYGEPPAWMQRAYAANSHGLHHCMFCEQPIQRLRTFRIDDNLTQHLFDRCISGRMLYGLCRSHARRTDAERKAWAAVERDCQRSSSR
jgi:hypothetical protein